MRLLVIAACIYLVSAQFTYNHLVRDLAIDNMPDLAIESDSVEIDTIVFDETNLGMTVYYSTTELIWQ